MIMYYHENNDNYKFILMWFINIGDEVHGSTAEENDGDQNDTSCVCDDPGIVVCGGCYMCIDIKSCLGVRCHIGAPRYTMLVFGFPFFGC